MSTFAPAKPALAVATPKGVEAHPLPKRPDAAQSPDARKVPRFLEAGADAKQDAGGTSKKGAPSAKGAKGKGAQKHAPPAHGAHPGKGAKPKDHAQPKGPHPAIAQKPPSPKTAGDAGHAAKEAHSPPEPNLPPIRQPRLTLPPLPFVARPTPMMLRRDATVLKDSGVSMYEHHDRVQIAVEGAQRAASEAQQTIVKLVEQSATSTVIEIERLAERIPHIVAQAIAYVTHVVEAANDEVQTAKKDAKQRIDDFKVLATTDFTKNRETVMKETYADLLKSSAKIASFDAEMNTAFGAQSAEAVAHIKDIGTKETAAPVSAELPPATKGEIEAKAKADEKFDKSGAPKTMSEVQKTIETGLGPAGKTVFEEYYDVFRLAMLDAVITERKKDIQRGLDAQADQVGKPETAAMFAFVTLGLTAPVQRASSEDEPGHQKEEKDQIEKQPPRLKSAKENAEESLDLKAKGVENTLKDPKNGILSKLVTALHKAGKDAQKALRSYAKVSAHALRGSAAAMADSYGDLIRRVAPLVPPNRFLDMRVVVPRVRELTAAVGMVRVQQQRLVESQTSEAVRGGHKAFQEQIDQIWKLARGSGDQMRDIIVPSRFDFDLAAATFTGKMEEGKAGALQAAYKHADHVRDQLQKDTRVIHAHLDPARVAAARFLNGSIESALGWYRERLNDTKRDYTPPYTAWYFKDIRDTKLADLKTRAGTLHSGLYAKPSAWATVGSFLASPIAGVAYVASNHTDEDVIFQQLGGLPWPGAKALQAVYEGEGTEPQRWGDLNEDLSRLSDSDAQKARNLLASKESAELERLNLSDESTATFSGPSKATREALLRAYAHDLPAGKDGDAFMARDDVKKLSDSIKGDLSGRKLEIASAYLDNHADRVLGIRIEDRLQAARDKGDRDISKMGDDIQSLAREELFGDTLLPEQIAAMTEKGIRANLAKAGTSDDELAKMDRAQVAERFAARATEDREVTYDSGGEGPSTTVMIPVGEGVREVLAASLAHGNDSKEADLARRAYSLKSTEGDEGSLSKTQTNDLNQAFEDRRLGALEAELEEAEKNHDDERKAELMGPLREAHKNRDEQMAALVATLIARGDASQADVDKAGGPTAYMANLVARRIGGAEAAQNVGSAYGSMGKGQTTLAEVQKGALQHKDTTGALFGLELINRGRARVVTGSQLASLGAGTNEELLKSTFSGRRRSEFDQARTQYQAATGDDFDVMLGLKEREHDGWDTAAGILFGGLGDLAMEGIRGGETSGDLAQELKKLTYGAEELRTDKDNAELAALEASQQLDEGTGFLSSVTMSDTPEKRHLTAQRDRYGALILRAAGKDPRDPSSAYLPNGELKPELLAAAFEGGKGRNAGRLNNSALWLDMHNASAAMHVAAVNYQAEIDRQEAYFTSLITVIGIVVSAVLMIIPGVNVIAAGVLSALVTGALTMAVKAGMRGQRYGYEEALTDVAMTAIEAATGALGGAMGKGAAEAGKLASAGAKIEGNILVRLGAATERSLGKVGGAVAREGLVGLVNGASRAALQDETWNDGIGTGIGRVLGGGLRGAVVSGVTGGVSTAVGHVIESGLTKGGLLERAGTLLGSSGREFVRDTISGVSGSVASELTNILIDVASGHYQGDLGDALKSLGEAGLRELFSAGLRSIVTIRNKARYHDLLDAARRSPNVSEADLHVLRLAAISAGEAHYGDSLDGVRHQVETGRAALQSIPESLRSKVGGLDAGTLVAMRNLVASETLGTAKERIDVLRALRQHVDGLDTRGFLRELEGARTAVKADEAAAVAARKQQNALRGRLGAELEGPARRALMDVSVDGLERLPPSALRDAAAMIARGQVEPATVDALVATARAADPNVDEAAVRRSLGAAVEKARPFVEERRAEAEFKRAIAASAQPGAEGVAAAEPARAPEAPHAEVGIPHGASASPDPRAPAEPAAPKVVMEPFSGPSLESAIDLAKKYPGAKIIATEATILPKAEEVARLRAAGGAFIADNMPASIPPGSVDEMKMRFPIPHERAIEQDFLRRLTDLETAFPNKPRVELMQAALAETVAKAETATAYGPYALERLKPGGGLEVVFWEKGIGTEVSKLTEMRFVDPATGKGYRFELDGITMRPKNEVAPFSGFGVPITADSPVSVARLRKVELEPATGARGPVLTAGEVVGTSSGRAFFPERAGGPVRELDYSRIKFTERAVDIVEAHIRRFGGPGETDMELAMVERARRIARNEIPATDFDRAFYSHELRESVRYRRAGWANGQPADRDAAYALWNDLHTATLEDYRLREHGPDGKLTLFHPDVEEVRPKAAPTGAQGPEAEATARAPSVRLAAPGEPLEPRMRSTLERELRNAGHAGASRGLSDADLIARYSALQVEQAPKRMEDFRATLSPEAQGELDALRASPDLRYEAVEGALAARMSAALETPIHVDPELSPGEVRVAYDVGLFGNVRGVRLHIGAGATLEDVLFHVGTLHAFKRYEGVTGVLRRTLESVDALVHGGAALTPGSRAREAYEELRKLPAIVEARRQRLDDTRLDALTRARVLGEIDTLETQLASHVGDLADVGEGGGYVAARPKRGDAEGDSAGEKTPKPLSLRAARRALAIARATLAEAERNLERAEAALDAAPKARRPTEAQRVQREQLVEKHEQAQAAANAAKLAHDDAQGTRDVVAARRQAGWEENWDGDQERRYRGMPPLPPELEGDYRFYWKKDVQTLEIRALDQDLPPIEFANGEYRVRQGRKPVYPSLTVAEPDLAWPGSTKQRDRLQRLRTKAQRDRDAAPEGSEAYKNYQSKMAAISEALGILAARAFVRDRGWNVDSVRVRALSDATKRGVFDLVYENNSPPPRFVIIEAKGATSPIGSALVDKDRHVAKQDTPEYFLQMLTTMEGRNATLVAKIRQAYAKKGYVEYYVVRAPIDGNEVGDIEIDKVTLNLAKPRTPQ